MLISLTDYAKKHDRHVSSVRQKVETGTLKAVKIGNSWAIDEDEPYVDHRVTHGRYVKKDNATEK